MAHPSPATPAALPATAAFASAVTALVNEVYRTTEGPLWAQGVERTSAAPVLATLQDGRTLGVCGVPDDPSTLLGTVTVDVEGALASFGTLAVSPTAGGGGLGGRLVRAAEAYALAHGAGEVEIEVLRPTTGTLPAKELLASWYPRLGYRLVSSGPTAQLRPDLLAVLAVETTIDRYRRVLERPT